MRARDAERRLATKRQAIWNDRRAVLVRLMFTCCFRVSSVLCLLGYGGRQATKCPRS
jgi:hypothetical protein